MDKGKEKRQTPLSRSSSIPEDIAPLELPSVHQKCMQLMAVQDAGILCKLLLDSLLIEGGAHAGLLWVREGEASETFTLTGTQGEIDVEKFPIKFILSLHPHASFISQGKLFNDPASSGQKSLYIPLSFDGDILGLAYIVHGGKGFREKDARICSTIAGFGSLALRNSFRIRQLSQGAIKEWGSGPIYTFNYFMEYMSKQILQARRYQKTFSLLVLSIENYLSIAKKFHQPILKVFVEKIMTTVGQVVRDADLVARKGEDSLILLLPETDYFGSLMVSRRIHKVLKGKRYIADQSAHMPVKITISSASFPRDGEDSANLMKVLSQRMEDQKSGLFTKLGLEDKDFWNIVTTLMESKEGMLEGQGNHSTHVMISPTFIDDIQREIFQEIFREKDRRGILFIGGPSFDPLPFGDTQSRVFVLQGTLPGSEPPDWIGLRGNRAQSAITRMATEESEASTHRFILFLNEDYAYGLLSRYGHNASPRGFHTDDPILVDRLIATLQDKYFHQAEVG